MLQFPTTYSEIINRVRTVDPISYARSRNFLDGAISYLSPYISRGVISLPLIKKIILEKYAAEDCQKFFQELGWREYFQRVWQSKKDEIFYDLSQLQPFGEMDAMPLAVVNAKTAVKSIDDCVQTLYNTGYMHNHWRMYVASICCNFARTKWLLPSKWMYYYLLDADLASNSLSWQWVAASFSRSPYFFNQDNLNKYSKENCNNSFLNIDYSQLPLQEVPSILQERIYQEFTTPLPKTSIPLIDPDQPLLIYTHYNLDPLWRKDDDANRVLLLSPALFQKFPMCERSINFIIELAKNIQGLQVFTGELAEIPFVNDLKLISKEHPLFSLPGEVDEREWLYETVSGFFPSFSSYQRKVEQQERSAKKLEKNSR